VDLCRTLALGTADAPGVLIHVAYLGAIAGGGLLLAERAFRRRLEL
jgi:lipooligosaccharide transport system permease protein